MPDTQARQTVAARIKRPLLAGALAVAATAIVAASGAALADTFLRLDGIDGESTDEKHKGEIDILSFTQSWINSSSISPGGGSGVGKVVCGAITLMKNIDKSSPQLLKYVVQGKHISEGTITFQGNGKQSPEYYTIRMSEIFVNELTQTDAADPNRIFEKVVLTAAKYDFEYRLFSDKGTVVTPVKAGYNCKTSESF